MVEDASGTVSKAGEGGSARAPRRWRPAVLLLGLAALALLAVATIATAERPVEAELTARAVGVLDRSGESWAAVSFDGRDATLTGESLAEEARAKVRASLREMFGVRIVKDETTLLPERRPFTFSAVKSGKTLALDGYVPSKYALARILAAARATGATVTGEDRLIRARGAPPGDFAALATFAIAQLDRLPSGRITLSDGALAIEGRAADLAGYDALRATMEGPLPQGMTLARFAVRPPVASPFLFIATRDPAGVRLSGYVPSEDARAEALRALRGLLPGVDIRDETRLADGAPATDLWLRAVRLAGRALAAVPGGRVGLADSTISIEASAPDFAAYDALTAIRRAPPEGFQITRFAVEPPRVAPFAWKLARAPERVVLTGYAPSDEARRLLVDAARGALPGVGVVDEMRLASGGPSPEAWATASSFAVAQLAKLRVGAAQVTGARVLLAGEALDSASYGTLHQAAAQPPAGLAVDAGAVRPPAISPYVFAVRREGDALTLSGFYPDEAAHQALRATLERDFLKEKLTDVSAIGGGAPKGFLDAAQAGLSQLARLGTGEMRLSDTQMRLSGTVLRPGADAEIAGELARRLQAPFTTEVALEAAPPGAPATAPECQKSVNDLLVRATILFDSGSPRIDRRSLGLLDRLAFSLARCPGTIVEITGHTDSDGAAAANQLLSEMRAEAVVGYLADAGIARGRLSGAGYGTARPVAPNDTEAGKALNRRIEITVKEGASQ
ncbi:OmpA family protein [Xanthobacter sp. KR7-225]|uniref:OmpA family protein n=1 Tax=Xanthobacter sp. KR7-225 TaxID=3156613 RepID=UPI0032B4F974